MIIIPIPTGPIETNAYILACPETRRALIIDPGFDSAESIKNLLEEHSLNAEKILLTHSHWDHFGDAHKLNFPLYVHPLDSENVRSPGSDHIPMMMQVVGVEPAGVFENGDAIECGTLKFEVIETPGHSPGGVCFYERNQGVLISGDTLFKDAYGILSIPTAEPEMMWLSLKKLAELPAETRVFPGHGNPTTIGSETWLYDIP